MNEARQPQQIKLRRNPRTGHVNWKKMLDGAEPGDWMILPLSLRPSVYAPSYQHNKQVEIHIQDNNTCKAVIVAPDHGTRKAMLKDFYEMGTKRLTAVWNAAKQAGLIR